MHRCSLAIRTSLVVALAMAGVSTRSASACSTCSCGEPTLTSVGSEVLYRHRVRASLDTRAGAVEAGAPANRHRTSMIVSTLAMSYAPIDRLQLSAMLPWQAQWMARPTTTTSAVGLGDFLLMARAIVARDRRFAPQHLFSIAAGLKAPTGPRIRGSDDYYLADDEQPGSGSWDPVFAISYASFALTKVSLFARSSGTYVTGGRNGFRRGSTFDTYVGAQYQPHARVALQLDLSVFWRDADRLSNGARSPDSGGTWLGVTPGIVVSPADGALLRFSLYIPAGQFVSGHQWVSPQGAITFSYDIH